MGNTQQLLYCSLYMIRIFELECTFHKVTLESFCLPVLLLHN